jgi:tetraacyldisaccharide 4'-kinase
MSVETQLVRLWYGNSLGSWLLWPVSIVYRGLVGLDKLWASIRGRRGLPVPTVVVGNVTVGGTGKTPGVIWLAQQLSAMGLAVGIISRGYGGRSSGTHLVEARSDPEQFGDEPALIQLRTGCPVAVGRDRLAAGALLLRHYPLDIVISDDGLQHWRLKADYELAIIDGMRGLGNRMCLPAGPLRESASRLRRVDAVLVNGEPFAYPAAWRGHLRVDRVYPLAEGESVELESFRGQPVHAVAAIGNPDRFAALLRAHGLTVTLHPLRDHQALEVSDLSFENDWPILITEKDAVKCQAMKLPNVWVVVVSFEVERGDELLAEIRDQVTRHG